MPAALSIALYYFALLGSLGIYWPYFSLHLAGIGFAPSEITRLMAVGPVMGALVPVAMGLLADARRARVWLLRAGSAASVFAFALLLGVDSRAAIWIAFTLFAIVRSPLVTLVDASAVEHVRERGGSYGALRLWGSAGFLCAVAGGGVLADALGTRSILWGTTLLLAGAALFAWGIPAPPVEKQPGVLAAWSKMLAARELRLFLAAVLLAQIACSGYDGCFSLHLQRLGHGGRFTGVAWALGVLAEIGVLAGSAGLLARHGAERVLAFSLATAALRWLLMASVTSTAAILALQTLHGITFGCFHAASVAVMRDRGERTPTAAQGLYLAVAALGTTLGMAVGGRVFEIAGGGALFGAASTVAALAFACAWRFAVASEQARVAVKGAA